jgi:hypothetical protein
MVYQMVFMIHLGYIQSIKQFAYNPSCVDCMTCLFIRLYYGFEALAYMP